MSLYNPCIIIPCYNHGGTMSALVEKLALMGLPIVIVDDGSGENTEGILRWIEKKDYGIPIRVFRHEVNMGKGAAVETACREAARLGHSHALQIDADGQHDVNAIPSMLAISRTRPDVLVSGNPVYDESIPRSRRIGRWITHVWVWIETLSFRIKDSMCGFRVYPLSSTISVFDRVRIGRRMDFDTEIMVRLFWDGVPVVFVPVRVVYPEGGISHFRAFQDNVRISWMHTRLFLGMLPRIPRLLARKFFPEQHWSRMPERRGLLGMRFMLATYRVLGRWVFSVFLIPVIPVFWLTGWRQRRASKEYLARVKDILRSQGRPTPAGLNSYCHFYRFAQTMLDKVAVWSRDITEKDVEILDEGCLQPFLGNEDASGAIVLTAHLGNPELCRALGSRTGKVVNAIVFSDHADRFNKVLSQVAPDAYLNLFQATEISAGTAIVLKEKIDRGEWLAIAADRTAVKNPGRVVWTDFLGKTAPFPEGPFALAAVMKCPVFLMLAFDEKGRRRVYVEPFAEKVELPRQGRREALERLVRRFAGRLEHYVLGHPLDWFNFYDFWRPAGLHLAEKEDAVSTDNNSLPSDS